MCNYDCLTQAQKDELKQQIQDIVEMMGGLNFFLKMIEKLRASKPHPLSARNSKVMIDKCEISWDKVIFLDKVTLLEKAIKSNRNENKYLITFDADDKKNKTIINLIRTLSPITFKLKIANHVNGVDFKVFNEIGKSSAELNPLFVSIFFCYVNFIKTVLKD
ncbi:hypothetical protein KKA17_01195 [bacterium]|nr:hypothetical protein [bacterium]MBU1882915.1 hypothetical protein [bacterium]